MEKKEILCLEYNVFCRVLNHWEEFEKNSLPVVLNNILEEIEKELNTIALQEFTFYHNYF
jgi:hypothetical protein